PPLVRSLSTFAPPPALPPSLFAPPARRPALPSFPTRRSSDLQDRSTAGVVRPRCPRAGPSQHFSARSEPALLCRCARLRAPARKDRKSTSELQSRENLVCRLLLEKKKSQLGRYLG